MAAPNVANRHPRPGMPIAPSALQGVLMKPMSSKMSPDLTLEAELIRIFASLPCTRNQEILMGYYGWEDGQTHTLTEIGDRFGITRERVRQICAKLIKKRPASGTISAPVMDRTLALIEKRIPATAEILEAELVEKGLTALDMSLEVVVAAAKLLNRPPRFKIVKIDQGKAPAAARLKIKAKPIPAPEKSPINMRQKAIWLSGPIKSMPCRQSSIWPKKKSIFTDWPRLRGSSG